MLTAVPTTDLAKLSLRDEEFDLDDETASYNEKDHSEPVSDAIDCFQTQEPELELTNKSKQPLQYNSKSSQTNEHSIIQDSDAIKNIQQGLVETPKTTLALVDCNASETSRAAPKLRKKPSSATLSSISCSTSRAAVEAAHVISSAARVEARRIKQRQTTGQAVSMLLAPSSGLREDIKRAGGKPKDHAKDNKNLIKRLQEDNKKRKEALSQPPPPPFKLKQFENVKPKVDSSSESSSRASTRPPTACSMGTEKKNYIQMNARHAKEMKNHRRGTSGTITPPTPDPSSRGQIPKYLLNRKLEWAKKEEERLRQLEEAKIPPGMMILSEQERLETLETLAGRRDQVLQEISKSPVFSETLRAKKRKQELEKKLNEIEDAIQLFSKKVVYIAKA